MTSSTRPLFVAIVAIGTEIVTGQIANSNAAWLSERLEEQGFEVRYHLAVPDNRLLILETLRWLQPQVSWIWITGGLGPTTDDLTREVVAEWLEKPLEYQESAWEIIQERHRIRGIPVAASNRQQCFFPKGARLLKNPVGTAAGFYCHTDPLHVWVLPGPPPEIQAIWQEPQEGIQVFLDTYYPDARQQKATLQTWQCLGKSEAALGELVEEALKGSGFQTGYRYHSPWIEIKVWIPHTEQHSLHTQNFLTRLEEAIAPWVFARGTEDIAAPFLNTFLHQAPLEAQLWVVDQVTEGGLAQRFRQLLKKSQWFPLKGRLRVLTKWGGPQSLSPSSAENNLAILPADWQVGLWPTLDTGTYLAQLQRQGHIQTQPVSSPYHSPQLKERNQAFLTERIFPVWQDLV